MATVDLCTIANYREQAEQPSTTTTSDALVQSYITTASRALAIRYDREFITEVSGSTARTFRVDGFWVPLAPYDLRAAPTSVVLHPESASPVTLAVNTDYAVVPGARRTGWRLRLAPRLNLASGFASEFGWAQLQVTGTQAHWGMFADTAGVPDDIRRACVLTVMSWLQRDIGSLGIQGIDDDRAIRPQTATGWPIPLAAHLLMRPYEPVRVY